LEGGKKGDRETGNFPERGGKAAMFFSIGRCFEKGKKRKKKEGILGPAFSVMRGGVGNMAIPLRPGGAFRRKGGRR